MTLKIRHKLFLAILTANCILAASIFVMSNWSLSHSFRQYLDATQAKRLEPLVSDLETLFRQENNWQWAKSRRNRIWMNLMREHVHKRPPPHQGFPPPPGQQSFRPPHPPPHFRPPQGQPIGATPGFPPPGPPPPGPPPPGRASLKMHPAILLADADKKIIIGPTDRKQQAYWLPITVDGSAVGYLGFFRTLELTDELDQLFIKQLQTSFIWILLAMIGVSAMIAMLLARRLVEPVEKLQHATHQLASGSYDTRVDINAKDELGELGQDFNRLADTLSKNLRARQQWIADISHELRTPVSVLRGELEALQDGVRDTSPAAIDSLHQDILRLAGLIDDLHQLSLSDMGALSYRKEPLNIVEVIADVLESAQASISNRRLEVTFRHSGQHATLTGDYHRLVQLFFNLLNNSIAYTDEAGRIDIEITRSGDNIDIDWCDSHPGVEDSDLEKLFDRLYRTDGSRDRRSGGSGLGLAICKNIVEAHEGTIVAGHSGHGGICLHLRFPAD